VCVCVCVWVGGWGVGGGGGGCGCVPGWRKGGKGGAKPDEGFGTLHTFVLKCSNFIKTMSLYFSEGTH
jgi:hypothetical protein